MDSKNYAERKSERNMQSRKVKKNMQEVVLDVRILSQLFLGLMKCMSGYRV